MHELWILLSRSLEVLKTTNFPRSCEHELFSQICFIFRIIMQTKKYDHFNSRGNIDRWANCFFDHDDIAFVVLQFDDYILRTSCDDYTGYNDNFLA